MKLSLCMIVKNEEANLPRCLASVREAVDELVIMDTGSTDRTPEIAQEFGAKVHHFKWPNNFSIARNQSLKYVQGDWVLVLDADEVLVPEVVPLLRQLIQKEEYLVFNLVCQELGAAQSPYSLVSRLFRRHPGIYFSRPYHAMIDESVDKLLIQEPHWQIGSLQDVAIRHDGYRASVIAERDKFATAKAAMESFLTTHPDEPYACSKLGALYLEQGEPDRGRALLELGLQSNQANPAILYELHYHLGLAYTRLKNPRKAEFHYQEAIEQPILPILQIGAYNNLGNLLRERKDFPSAILAYQTAVEIDPTFAMGYCHLGMVLKASNRWMEAIAAYRRAINLNPQYAEAYQNIGVVFLKVGEIADCKAAFQRAIILHHEQGNFAEAERLGQGLLDMGL
jgi:glycosyltransferase involved in cell wall biosynthesis